MNPAHAAFLASLPPLDPILQQVASMNQMYVPPTIAPVPVPVLDLTAPNPQADMAAEAGRLEQEGVQEAMSEEVFSMYRHREIVPGCKPHPADIVEAAPLAALSLPEENYPITDSLPTEAIDSGKLSSLQLEGIIHACQRHQVLLPSGQRAGFFVGDGAGVGKGRQIAGIILDNFARGRTKHVWFSISADLIVDARRDLQDIGCHVKVIDGCQELDKETRVFGLSADFKEGVVFSTYATLVSSAQRGGAMNSSRQSRLQQLISWCGGDQFNGCLIFDECHKAKNFIPNKEQASTKVALAVTSIQRYLPQARVVYCSATGVTDVKNMAFMERLGLWGEGSAFKSFEQFLDSIQRKGLGVAEMLAMEMKSTGLYVSRGLSFRQAEFVTVEAKLTEEQVVMYNRSALVWNELRKALESAILRTDCSNGRLWQLFWSAHQRFFKQMCIGMKVPTIVAETKAALEAGHCVVIGLQTTGEASLDSELSRSKTKGCVTGFISLCREILLRFISNYFPTRMEKAKEGEPAEDSWAVEAKKRLLEFAEQIKLPDSPLDEIIDKLGGPSGVAEMTGRKGRVVRNSSRDLPSYESRGVEADSNSIDSLNVQERNLFMSGKKLVAIISDAASTGISLHADLRAKNQRRRVHLTVELPWSADKAVQQMGRSHRSNQSSGPLYKLLTTDLGGERRFAAAVARRLQSLGALTKGDRRAATGADLTEFNFDTPYGRSSLRMLYHCISQRRQPHGVSLQRIVPPGMSLDDFHNAMQECLVLMGLVEYNILKSTSQVKEKEMGDVGKFLNRILGLSVEKQNMIFCYFTECLEVTIENAKNEGRYNEGMLDIQAASVEMVGTPKEVFIGLTRGTGTTRLVELKVDRGMSWEAALARYESHPGPNSSFYISRRDMFGRKLYILATPKESSSHLFKIARPNTGVSGFDEEKSDLLHKYMPISLEKAEKGWRQQYEQSGKGCMHGASCTRRSACHAGSRTYRLHLLCGSIMSLMSMLETTLNRFALKLSLSKYESSIRVVRAELSNGERIVGIRYPSLLIPEVEALLREQQKAERMHQAVQAQDPLGATLSTAPLADTQLLTFTTEDVAPINPRCRARALNPPVTIKNFFKPKEKTEEGTPPSSQVGSQEFKASLVKEESFSQPSSQESAVRVKAEAAIVLSDESCSQRASVKDTKSDKARGCKRKSSGKAAQGKKTKKEPVKRKSTRLQGGRKKSYRDEDTSDSDFEESPKLFPDSDAESPESSESNNHRSKLRKKAVKDHTEISEDSDDPEFNSPPVKEEESDESEEKFCPDDSEAESWKSSNQSDQKKTEPAARQESRSSDSGEEHASSEKKPKVESEPEVFEIPDSDSDTDNPEDIENTPKEVKIKEEKPASSRPLSECKSKPVQTASAKEEPPKAGPAKTTRKRSLHSKSASGPSKGGKQSTIFSAFAAQKRKAEQEEEEKKPMKCPVCALEFEPGTSNADINSHIDNCLIE